VITARSLRDTITNALDFLFDAELILYANSVEFSNNHVSWTGSPDVPFLLDYGPATSDQYLGWLAGHHYSALLGDGSLLQMTYRVRDGDVVSHRLAYVPCPVLVDEGLLRSGEPVGDIVEIYLATQPPSVVALRSPVRFDFDPATSTDLHPAAHLTINGSDCRIACVAPMHPYRFVDFIFRHFYPELRASQGAWFDGVSRRPLGRRVLTPDDALLPHLMWPAH
jgi:hypothetical protein